MGIKQMGLALVYPLSGINLSLAELEYYYRMEAAIYASVYAKRLYPQDAAKIDEAYESKKNLIMDHKRTDSILTVLGITNGGISQAALYVDPISRDWMKGFLVTSLQSVFYSFAADRYIEMASSDIKASKANIKKVNVAVINKMKELDGQLDEKEFGDFLNTTLYKSLTYELEKLKNNPRGLEDSKQRLLQQNPDINPPISDEEFENHFILFFYKNSLEYYKTDCAYKTVNLMVLDPKNQITEDHPLKLESEELRKKRANTYDKMQKVLSVTMDANKASNWINRTIVDPLLVTLGRSTNDKTLEKNLFNETEKEVIKEQKIKALEEKSLTKGLQILRG